VSRSLAPAHVCCYAKERLQNLLSFLVSLYGYRLSIGSRELGEGDTSTPRVFLVTLRLGVDHSFLGFSSVSTFLLSALWGDLQAWLPILSRSYTDVSARW